MTNGIDVRLAHKGDVRALSVTLSRAFHDDPVMKWMVPEAAKRAKALPRIFAAMTKHHFLSGEAVEVAGKDGDVGAAALWDPPGRWKQTPREQFAMMPGFLLALGRESKRGLDLTELMKQHHPEEPHWYLAVIGSDPSVRGGGFGQALMRSRLDRCDAEYAPAYLESSNPVNLPYYQRFGFEVTGEIVVPDGGPTLWPMWRQPR